MSEFGEFWPDDNIDAPAIRAASDEAWRHLEARGGVLVRIARAKINDLNAKANQARDAGNIEELRHHLAHAERVYDGIEYLVSREGE